ncbi:MAG TPA: hypothetical protein VN682_17750 [Terriglobales bacterium]|jgi:hypothetical protein|nr:hypothetical protein [Terriglobales bacterium]
MQIIKSVGVLSVAKIFGLLYGCMGLIFVPIFLIMAVAGAMAGPKEFPFGGVLGVVLAFVMPIFYGGMGFVMGAVGALLYNLTAGWIGGFEVQLELAPNPQTATPAPAYPQTMS